MLTLAGLASQLQPACQAGQHNWGGFVRLAFQQLGSDQWAAGNLFLDSMFRALRMLGPDCPNLVLVADEATAEREFQDLTASVDDMLRAPV